MNTRRGLGRLDGARGGGRFVDGRGVEGVVGAGGDESEVCGDLGFGVDLGVVGAHFLEHSWKRGG